MRILIATPSYPPKIGGGERYTQALAEAAVQAGHAVTIITSDIAENAEFWRWHPRQRHARPSESVEDGIRVLRCPALGLPGGWPTLTLWRKAMVMLGMLGPRTTPLLERMARLIPNVPSLEDEFERLGELDLVHAYNLSWEYPLIVAWRTAQKRGIPFVVTPYAHLGAEVSARVTRNITMPHQLRAMQGADAILALPTAEAQGLIALGLRPDHVHAVGSGYDPHPAVAGGPDPVQHIEGPVVAFVGRISKDKGALVAADAVRMLRRTASPPPTLVLMGPLDDSFARYYARMSARERAGIVLLGPVSEQVKHTVLERAEMLVLPSRVDSFGIVLLEAWSHGKPVIGARAGGIPGVIDHGVDGLLVPWGDHRALAEAIETILGDPDRARRMGDAGRAKTAARYTWPAVYAQVEELYQRVLVARGHSTAAMDQS